MNESESLNASERVPVKVISFSEEGELIEVHAILGIRPIPELEPYKYVADEEYGIFIISVNRGEGNQNDGIKFYEKWCGPIEATDTLTIRTNNGGYYKVYKRTPELEGILKNGLIDPRYLCNIITAEDRRFLLGDVENIINDLPPQNPPKKVVDFISKKACTGISERINKVIGAQDDVITPRLELKPYKYIVDLEYGIFIISVNRGEGNQNDGIKFYEKWCGPIEATDTLTIRTDDGGYYKVYKRTPELEGILENGPIDPRYLCNIINVEDRRFFVGDVENIINDIPPQNPPKKVVDFISKKACTGISKRINKVIGAQDDIIWETEECNEGSLYILVPRTTECCVVPGCHHTSIEQSCLFVYKSYVVCNCHEHGTRALKGPLSRSIRDIFY